MHDFMLRTADVIAAIASIGVAVGAVWALFKKPWVAVRAWLKKTDDGLTQVYVMSQALGPNGGSSLYDKITSTEQRSQVTGARVDWLCDQLDRPNYECAPDGANVRINASFTTQFGYSPSEMLGQRWVRLIHPTDRERVMAEWEHAIGDKRMFESQFRAQTRHGVTLHVRAVAEPQPHPTTGVILRWLGRIEIVKSEAAL